MSVHYADAEMNLKAVCESIRTHGVLTRENIIAIAQVQATLALVEQQRIANILTLVGDEDWETVDADLREFGVDPAKVRADIVAAMGWAQ